MTNLQKITELSKNQKAAYVASDWKLGEKINKQLIEFCVSLGVETLTAEIATAQETLPKNSSGIIYELGAMKKALEILETSASVAKAAKKLVRVMDEAERIEEITNRDNSPFGE